MFRIKKTKTPERVYIIIFEHFSYLVFTPCFFVNFEHVIVGWVSCFGEMTKVECD